MLSSHLDAALTPTGSRYVMRVLHPNDDTEGSGVMIPDMVDTERVTIELRNYQVFQKPSTLPDANWDILFYILPFSDVPCAYRVRQSGTTAWSNPVAIATDNALAPGAVRLGDLTSDPAVDWGNLKVPDIRTDNTGYRQVYKGTTIELNRSTLKDQGMVTAGQMIEKPTHSTCLPYIAYDPATMTERQGMNKIPVYQFEGLPTEEEQIVRWCPQATQWEAKKGIYMPSRTRETVNIFDLDTSQVDFVQSTTNVAFTQDVGSIIQINIRDRDNTDDSADRVAPYGSTNPNDCVATGGLGNQAVGVILFRGIDSTSQCVFKQRIGVELIPKQESNLHCKAEKPVTPDELAIKAVTAIAVKLPVAFEHRFNSMGALLPLIQRIASTVLPAIAPWLNKLLGGNFINSNKTRSSANAQTYMEPSLD